MNTILITLHKWNENMCRNFQSGTLYKTSQAPMFTPTLLELVAHRHRLHRHRHRNPSTSSASCHPKPGTRCPTLWSKNPPLWNKKNRTYFWVVLLCLTPKQLQKVLTIATFGDCGIYEEYQQLTIAIFTNWRLTFTWQFPTKYPIATTS